MSTSRERGNRCQVTGCGRPAPAGVACDTCLEDLETALGDFAVLAHALEARYLHQQRFSIVGVDTRPREDTEQPRQEESPLPFDDRAGRLRRELSRFLLHWITQAQPAPCGYPVCRRRHHQPPPRNTVESEAAWLLNALPWFRTNPAGAKITEEAKSLHARILIAVDRPPDLVYLGVCSMPDEGRECPEDLYAEWGADHAKCRRCKHDHRVDDRRSVLLIAVKDQLATASDIARGLSGLGMGVTAERIRKWKERGRLIERGPSYRGSPLYRVGDVIDRVLADQERKKA